MFSNDKYYSLKFSEKAAKQYDNLDNSIRIKVNKKIEQLLDYSKKRRHLRFGELYYVDEVGQFRIIYEIDYDEKFLIISFIGKHKEYEKFLMD